MALTKDRATEEDFHHLMAVEFRAGDVARTYESMKKAGYVLHPNLDNVLRNLAEEVRQRKVR